MDIFEFDKLALFLLFFIPGFISMKVYHLLIASDKVNFSESLGEAMAFSAINYASLFWLILLMYKKNLYENSFFWFVILWSFIILIAPILWTIFYVWLTRSSFFKKRIISPFKSPWDYFFEKRESCWILVHLKNGERIGGIYSSNSFASAYPHVKEIYLEQVWEVDCDGKFIKQKTRSKGIIICGNEISSFEFFN
ncbi:DUF6338 family protein [Cytophagaceae bacterium ABcell3]|nr:DUF6338 family protein [Cytophagaceae bacterium ABcell3]